jgi:hypothetical protein
MDRLEEVTEVVAEEMSEREPADEMQKEMQENPGPEERPEDTGRKPPVGRPEDIIVIISEYNDKMSEEEMQETTGSGDWEDLLGEWVESMEKPEESEEMEFSADQMLPMDSEKRETILHSLSLVAHQISDSTRNILRAFHANPAAIAMVQGRGLALPGFGSLHVNATWYQLTAI